MKNCDIGNYFMSITRSDLANAIYRDIGISFKESQDFADELMAEIIKAIIQEGEVKLCNFGSFKVSHKAARLGRNPKTGEEALISARNVVSFIASSKFKNQLISGCGDEIS